MEIGEKLRQARLEAGLSQRQLCGGEITRNMLSQIENGTARPSMRTLSFLAGRLGKSVSYFLEEDAVVSANVQTMAEARRCFDGGEYGKTLDVLNGYRQPDDTYDREYGILRKRCLLLLAEEAIADGKPLYAAELLEKAAFSAAYCGEALERQRLLLLGRLGREPVSGRLPSLDGELLLRAKEAMADGAYTRAAGLLEAAEDQTSAEWNLWRGRICLTEKDFARALSCLSRAEQAFPREVYPLLEQCCRELGDYRQAYAYACKIRDIS